MSRKSDIALPTIMNIFLMIAVILVASSFLLKAFGIDIMEFLKNLFGGMFFKPQKILFIKMDPSGDGNGKPEIYQFYLTKDRYQKGEVYSSIIEMPSITPSLKKYVSRFMPDELPGKYCVIYTVDENSEGIDIRDEGYNYYIKPGAVIQKDCGNNGNSLGDCLKDYIADQGCNEASAMDSCSGSSFVPITGDWELSPEECSNLVAGDFVFANCGCAELSGYNKARCDEKNEPDKRMVEKQIFFKDADFVKECKDAREQKCNLLIPNKYEIKYGLICGKDKDGNGIWYLCEKDTQSETHEDAVCNWNGVVGIWEFTKEKTKIGCAFEENCYFDKNSIELGEQVKVGGYLRTIEGNKPIGGEPLRLVLIKNENPWEYEIVKTVEATTNSNGYAEMYWTPEKSYIGEKRYYLEFPGSNLYEKIGSSISSLKIIPNIATYGSPAKGTRDLSSLSKEQWFRFISDDKGMVAAVVTPDSNLDVYATIYESDSTTWITGGFNMGGLGEKEIERFNAAANTDYFIKISWVSGSGSASITAGPGSACVLECQKRGYVTGTCSSKSCKDLGFSTGDYITTGTELVCSIGEGTSCYCCK